MRPTRSKEMAFSMHQDQLALQDGIVISKIIVAQQKPLESNPLFSKKALQASINEIRSRKAQQNFKLYQTMGGQQNCTPFLAGGHF